MSFLYHHSANSFVPTKQIIAPKAKYMIQGGGFGLSAVKNARKATPTQKKNTCASSNMTGDCKWPT